MYAEDSALLIRVYHVLDFPFKSAESPTGLFGRTKKAKYHDRCAFLIIVVACCSYGKSSSTFLSLATRECRDLIYPHLHNSSKTSGAIGT